MTYDEFKKLAKGMKSIWTQDNFLPDAFAIRTWYELLKDLPYMAAVKAVQNYASTSRWAPTPADLRSQVFDMVEPEEEWSEAWKKVIEAIGRYGMYRESEALESMSEKGREVVSRLGWKQICQSEQDDLPSIRANFRMIYQEKSEHDKAKALTSSELGKRFDELVGGMDVKELEG